MRIESMASRPLSERRSPAVRLREQLLGLACGHATILNHEEKAWVSVTFAGARHRVELAFEGIEAVEAGECFIAFLPEHEFAIPGQLVADAAVMLLKQAPSTSPGVGVVIASVIRM